MDELTEFVKARLDEDEDLALDLARGCPGPWSADYSLVLDGTGSTVLQDEFHQHVLPYIARHDPARVLREVAAKRAIVAQWEHSPVGSPVLTYALYSMAAVWSDHPDYRQEWAP